MLEKKHSSSQLRIGAILNYAIIVLNTVVGLLYTPYMLRMMGQSEYGLYSIVASVISYLTILDLGFGNAIIRYTAKYRAENKVKEQYEMFGMFFVLYSVIGVISFLIGLGLYFNVDVLFQNSMSIDELSKAKIMILLMVFNVAFTFPMSIYGAIINAYEHFIFPRFINILRIILNTCVMIVLLSMGYKALAMVVLQTIFNVLTLILNYVYCKYKLSIKMIFGKFNWSFLKEVSVYSFWIFLFILMDRIYWGTGQFVLGAVVGTTAVAIYAVAIQLLNMYMQFSNAISSLFLPKVTSMVVTNNNEVEISNLFIKTGRVQFAILAYILTAFLCFGRQFIVLWAGSEYYDAYLISILFFVPLTIPLIQNLGITILQARNQMEFRSILYIIIAFISLFFQIFLSKKWGGIGCAIAVSGALIVGQIIVMNIYYSLKQQINILRFWKEILKMSIIPIIIGCLTFITTIYYNINTWCDFLLSGILFSIIYIPLFVKFSLNVDEKKFFVPKIKKIIKWKK